MGKTASIDVEQFFIFLNDHLCRPRLHLKNFEVPVKRKWYYLFIYFKHIQHTLLTAISEIEIFLWNKTPVACW